MIIDAIGCLHGCKPALQGGDLLVITGDLTGQDTFAQHSDALAWLHKQEYKKKILIAGNHDNFLEKNPNFFSKTNIDYLCDSGTVFGGLKLWGSPFTKTFHGMNEKCKAFTVDTDEELAAKWALIPEDTEVLITHGPAWGMHDKVKDIESGKNINVGSPSLIRWISNHVDTLRLHVCSHIHEGYGIYDIRKIQGQLGDSTTPVFVNASIMNEHYRETNKPIRIEL